NTAGRVVSVDGRYSEGRSIYDLLPIQLKECIGRSTDEDVRRAIEVCRRMTIRGGIESGEEKEETPPTSSHLDILIERLETIEMHTPIFKEFVDSIVDIFKKMEEEAEEQKTSMASEMEEEIMNLEEEWMKMAEKSEERSERLKRCEEERRKSEEERRRMEGEKRRMEEERLKMEEEVRRTDDGRRKAMNDMENLRAKLVKMTAEKEEMTEAAREFARLHDVRSKEVEDADAELDALQEKYQQLEYEVDERDRKIRMLMEEINGVERNLEDQIKKNSEQSRKLVTETALVHTLEKEVREKRKELERTIRSKEATKETLQEMIDGMTKHYEVYCRVKERSVQRQILLDRVVVEIEKTRRQIGKCGRLERLEETIRSEGGALVSKDEVDFRECKTLQRQFNSAGEEEENK
ncbi:hypothetical protein PMAYCL1PPCAC_11977, partial [Pristionchus mayeri]